MLSLKEIPGVGDSLAEKLIFEIGSLADVERVIKDGDVSTLSCLLYTSPSPRDMRRSRMPSSA